MKALRVSVTPRMMELAKTLEGGQKDFRDLRWEHQVLLAESGINLDGLATDRELRQYEIEKQVKEAENPLERAKAEITKQLEGI